MCVRNILLPLGGGEGSVIENQLSRRQLGRLCCSFPGGFEAGFYFTNEAKICRRLRAAMRPISTRQLLKPFQLQLPNLPHVDSKVLLVGDGKFGSSLTKGAKWNIMFESWSWSS